MSGVKTQKSVKNKPAAVPQALAMLDALPEAVLALEDGVIVYANHAAMDFTRTSAKGLVGYRLADVFGAAHPACTAADAAAKGGQNLTLRDLEICQHPVARLSVSVMPSGAQSAVLLSWPVERVPLRSEWLVQQRTVMKPARELARMLAHEIKNPLAGIRGAAQLLGRALADDDDRALAALIDAETQRILRLLDKVSLLDDISAPESFSAVNLHGITDHVIECARAGFAAGAALRAEYDPSLPDIDGHADALVQAVMNLAKNAAEAGAHNIVLRTGYDLAPQYHPETGRRLPIVLSVEDDGPGMSAETAARLFEPCYTTKPEGEGLGLVVVSRVVDSHGGMVNVSRAGGKTVFRICFPLPPRRKEKTV
ncbi:MAG TPA: hypothetical protein DIW20_04140 [Rhodospirillaceae bacterium]|nr:hypothetical protein [Rhodospirillaceae bacterium]